MIVVGKLIPRSSGTLSTNITQEQPLLMLTRKPTFIQDVAQSLHIPYALAHMHLKILEESGLIEGSYVVEEAPRPHLRKMYRVKDFTLVIDKQLLKQLADRSK
ncbi:MAG: ArsR family transcriptional regulator [Thermocladium sp. ECH_B]|jgi:ArsR family transcriptional regulator|nr:MAG: ArsR family transcriptional regulator [Thermocladium sp. ECH_B]